MLWYICMSNADRHTAEARRLLDEDDKEGARAKLDAAKESLDLAKEAREKRDAANEAAEEARKEKEEAEEHLDRLSV